GPAQGGGLGGLFAVPGTGIGLLGPQVVVVGMDLVFVFGAPVQARDKPFPDSTAIPAHHQPMLPCTPVVEVPDYRYRLGRGGPYCKITAFLPLQFAQVRSQFFIEPKMFARLEEVDVEFCEKTMWDYLGHRGLFSIYNITHLCQRIPQVRPLCKRITVLCKNGTLFDFYLGTHLKTS